LFIIATEIHARMGRWFVSYDASLVRAMAVNITPRHMKLTMPIEAVLP
jgi:hypothetical protein